MMDAFKKALKQKQHDNFAIIIAKVPSDDNKAVKADQAPPAANHVEMAGDDAVDKSMVHNLSEDESVHGGGPETMEEEVNEPKSVVRKELMANNDNSGLAAKIKELIMSKSKKK